jgi:hypothetical protein
MTRVAVPHRLVQSYRAVWDDDICATVRVDVDEILRRPGVPAMFAQTKQSAPPHFSCTCLGR